MVFLLDTNIISNLEKRKPHPALLTWIGSLEPEDIAVSIGTIFEIQFGIEWVRPVDPVRAGQVEEWLEGLLETRFARFIEPGVEIARLQARIFAEPALKDFLIPNPRSKKPKTGIDLIIAATAIIHDATVATFDTGDFLRIHGHFPLPGVFDPGTGEYAVEPEAYDDPP